MRSSRQITGRGGRMMTSERMLEIYSGLKEVIARRKTASVYTSLGYTSNLDLIPEFTSEDLNRLLAAYLPDACLLFTV